MTSVTASLHCQLDWILIPVEYTPLSMSVRAFFQGALCEKGKVTHVWATPAHGVGSGLNKKEGRRSKLNSSLDLSWHPDCGLSEASHVKFPLPCPPSMITGNYKSKLTLFALSFSFSYNNKKTNMGNMYNLWYFFFL